MALVLLVMIVQYVNKNNVIAFAERFLFKDNFTFSKRLFLSFCVLLIIVDISFMLYGGIDELRSTKAFREEYKVGVTEIVLDNKIEMKIDNLEGKDKEWGIWALKEIRTFKWCMFYVVVTSLFVILMPILCRPKFEKEGVRTLITLKRWSDFTKFKWVNNKLILETKKNNKFYYQIKANDKEALAKYILDNTHLVKGK